MEKSKVSNLLSRDGLWFALYYFLRFTSLDRFVSDEPYLKLKYRCYTGNKLHLNPPRTFNEKLQWLKLHDHNPLYTTLVDKYEVKNWVANVIGEEYIIPTLGVWDRPEDIEWDKLPEQFVLKCTHDSGGLAICRDKNTFDREKAIRKLHSSLKFDYYKAGREWPYKNVSRRIIAEKFMEDEKTGELRDYKFFCFDGDVKALFVATDRQNREEPYFDFFDMDYNHLEILSGHPNAPIAPARPSQFDKMKELAGKLSKGFCHVRVDFYEVNGNVYFGEMTFYHHTGMVLFEPDKWNQVFGDWIRLPE